MTIPAKAVEAAAKNLYVSEHGPWDGVSGITSAHLTRARAALEAAAPHMQGEARAELVKLAKEFDGAEGGTLAYTASTDDGMFVMRKNAHDQLVYILDRYLPDE